MSRPKKDQIEAVLEAYFALPDEDRRIVAKTAFYVERHTRLAAMHPSQPPAERARRRKSIGPQPDGTFVGDAAMGKEGTQ